MQDSKNSKEFDLSLLVRVGLKFWYLILVGAILFGAIAGLYKTVTSRPIYSGTVSFWVSSESENSSNVLGAAQIATGYVELINKGPKALWDKTNSYESTKDASKPSLSDKWGLSINDTYSTLDAMVSATKSYDESFMFTLIVSSPSRERTFDAIFSLQYVTEEVLTSISGNPNVVRVSEVFDTSDISASSSSVLKYALVGAVLGAVLAYAVAFALYVYRRKIESAEHLRQSCELSVLASVNMSAREKSADGVSVGISADAERRINMLRTELLTIAGEAKVYGVIPSSDSISSDFISLCLAESFGAVGNKTLLVSDADADGAKGISVLRASNGANAWDGAALVLDKKEEYDFVVVALPSVCDISDLGAAVSALDAVVVATGKGERLESVQETAQLLSRAGIAPLGACYIE